MSAPRCLRCGAGPEWLIGRVPDAPPGPESEARTAYNALTYQQTCNDVIGPWERERIGKLTPWARDVITGLVKRIMNLRIELNQKRSNTDDEPVPRLRRRPAVPRKVRSADRRAGPR